MLKLIFRIIRGVITFIFVLALILYPYIVFKANPFTFYVDKLSTFWEAIKLLPIVDKISIFK